MKYLALSLLVLAPGIVWATNYPVTCSGNINTTLQEAMTRAASAGDTITLGAGSCSLTTTVTWNAPANAVLIGAGTTAQGGGDVTTLTDAYGSDAPIITINVTHGASATTPDFRLTGITVNGGAVSGLKQSGVIQMNATGGEKSYVRIDHMHFDTTTYGTPNSTTKIIQFGGGAGSGSIYGVMDNCIADFYRENTFFFYNSGTASYGDSVFAEDTNFGTNDFFYFEDNLIRGQVYTCYTTEGCSATRLFDAMMAGKVVARFNTFTAATGGEAHDTGSAGDTRGQRAVELYGNTFARGVGQTVGNYDLIRLSNGVGLVWGNTTGSDAFTHGLLFKVIRRNDEHGAQTDPPGGWGQCGTEYDGTGSAWDYSAVTTTGYPCLDQPGRGKSNLLTGSFAGSNRRDNTTGTVHWPDQSLEPIYIWNNTVDIQTGWGGECWICDETSGRLSANVDYYDQSSGIQTNATTPFNGTSGTGWGTIANRPTTCTTGVAYWATNEGSWNTSASNPYGVQQSGADGNLYKCVDSAWVLYYTPYTYPHPLRGVAAAETATHRGVTCSGCALR